MLRQSSSVFLCRWIIYTMWYWRKPNNQPVVSAKAVNGLRSKPKSISDHKSTFTSLNQSNPCTNAHNPHQSKQLVITSKLDQNHGFNSIELKPLKGVWDQRVLLLRQWPGDHVMAGENESNVMKAFKAEKNVPSIIFIDEIDFVPKTDKTHG